jgi:capsular exopolysaccharide synthesis family protein
MESQQISTGFDKYLQVAKRRAIPALSIFFPVFLISLLASSLKKPVYVAEGKLLFQRTNTVSTLTGVATEVGKLEPLVEQKTNPLNTEAEVLRSVPVVQQTIDRLNLKDDEGKPLKPPSFIENLTVNDIQKTDVLKVAYENTDPELAAKVVNTLMAVYLEYNVSSHRTQATAARTFLEKQVPNAQLVLRKAEAALAEFQEKNKIISLQEEGKKAVELIAELEKQISQVKSQFADVNAQYQSLSNQLKMNSQQGVYMASLSQSNGVQDILKEIQQAESQLASRRVILQDSHPEIISLESKLQSLLEILDQRVKQVGGNTNLNANLQIGALQEQLIGDLVRLDSTRQGLFNQVNSLSKLQIEYKQRLNNLPRLEQQQRQLEREVQASQATYSLLSQRLHESRIAENQNLGNASLVSKAEVPEEPVSSPMVSYLSAGLLAMLASLALMYLLEIKDKSIKTVEEAKELTGLTLLGVIPAIGKSKKSLGKGEESSIPKVIVKENPRSPISEAYRMLRANLKFMSADKELKVIVVTSSVPREGKSTVAANLAMSMAQMERRVLLIDGDLHRPIQDKIWDISNNYGLSNVIVGQVEIMKAIKKVMDNLDVLTSGVVPPSPASLLDSKRMASLVESFSAYYDCVIIDAPSLNLAADAATLGQMADGVLLVVRPGVVDSVNATLACELLEKSGQNVLGQVVNGVVPQNEQHMRYYFEEEYYSEGSVKRVDVVVS